MKTPEVAQIQADLQKYLRGKGALFSPGIEKVIAHVGRFTSDILQSGFQTAFEQLGSTADARADRPFIEVCDAIVEQHVRFLNKRDRELMAKSLLEAYIYAAGTEHAFEPLARTRMVASLRRRGTKGFATAFLSLHLFNLISIEIQDDVRMKAPDLKSFELYMLWIETACREIVSSAMSIPDGCFDEKWAAAVCADIERRLLDSHHS